MEYESKYPFGEPKYSPWNYSTTEDIYSRLPREECDYAEENKVNPPYLKPENYSYTAPPLAQDEFIWTGPKGWEKMHFYPEDKYVTEEEIKNSEEKQPTEEFTNLLNLSARDFVLIAILIVIFYLLYQKITTD
jgi:hypothetical protein